MNKEQTMEYLEEFRKCVMEGDASFGIDVPYGDGHCQYMHFLQYVAEKSKIIYASCSMNEPDFGRLLSYCSAEDGCGRWKFAAFATRDGKVCIYDRYALQLPYGMELDPLPDGICWFEKEMGNLREFIMDRYLPEYIEGLPVKEERYADEASQKEIREGARELLLMGRKPEWKAMLEKAEFEDMTGEQQAFDHLCGYRDIKDAVKECLDSKREYLIDFKTKKFLVENLEPDLATEPWERELAQTIRNAGAKQVTVTFMVGSRAERIKIECRRLLRRLKDGDSFCEWDFPTQTAGKGLFSSLGISNSYRSANRLTCGHIVKAEYRKKVLFER